MMKHIHPQCVLFLCFILLLFDNRYSISLAAEWTPEPTSMDDEMEAILTQQGGVGLIGWTVNGDETGPHLCSLGSAGERVEGSGEPVDASPTGRWHIGSNTKSMTATVLAILIERGEGPFRDVGGWDAVLSAVAPDIAVGTVYENVTLRQLVGMGAGIMSNPAEGMGWFKYESLTDNVLEQRALAARDALQSSPVVPPGTGFTYSNWAYVVAGHLVENATGLQFEQVLANELFDPLGFPLNVTTSFGAPDGDSDAWGHYGDAQTPCDPATNIYGCDNPVVMGPAGRFSGTSEAMAAYLAWHVRCHNGVDETGILSQDLCIELHSPDTDMGSNANDKYGFGWACTQREWATGDLDGDVGLACNHMGSNTMWYHDMWIAPEIERAFVAATNGASRTGDKDFVMVDAAIAALISGPSLCGRATSTPTALPVLVTQRPTANATISSSPTASPLRVTQTTTANATNSGSPTASPLHVTQTPTANTTISSSPTASPYHVTQSPMLEVPTENLDTPSSSSSISSGRSSISRVLFSAAISIWVVL